MKILGTAIDEVTINLQKLWPGVEDHPVIAVTEAKIIDGNAHADGAQRSQRAQKTLGVEVGHLFDNLHHDADRVDAASRGRAFEKKSQIIVTPRTEPWYV